MAASPLRRNASQDSSPSFAANVKQLVSRFSDDTIFSAKSPRSHHLFRTGSHEPMPSFSHAHFDLLNSSQETRHGATVVRTVDEALEFARSHSRNGSSSDASRAGSPALHISKPLPPVKLSEVPVRPRRAEQRTAGPSTTKRPHAVPVRNIPTPPLTLRPKVTQPPTSDAQPKAAAVPVTLASRSNARPVEALAAAPVDSAPTCACHLLPASSDDASAFEAVVLIGERDQKTTVLELDVGGRVFRTLAATIERDGLCGKLSSYARSVGSSPSSSNKLPAKNVDVTHTEHGVAEHADTDADEPAQLFVRSLATPSPCPSPFVLSRFAFDSRSDLDANLDEAISTSPIDPLFSDTLFVPPSRHLLLASIEANRLTPKDASVQHVALLVPSPTDDVRPRSATAHISSSPRPVSSAATESSNYDSSLCAAPDGRSSSRSSIASQAPSLIRSSAAERSSSHSDSDDVGRPHRMFLDRDPNVYEHVLAFARSRGRLPPSLDFTCRSDHSVDFRLRLSPDLLFDRLERLTLLKEEAVWLDAQELISACEASLHHLRQRLQRKLEAPTESSRSKAGWI